MSPRPTRTLALTVALLVCLAVPATLLASTAPQRSRAAAGPVATIAKNCGDRHGQFLFGQQGVLVLSLHRVPCAEVKKLARTLIRQGGRARLDGYRCAQDRKIHAGGGAYRCVDGSRSVEFGFE